MAAGFFALAGALCFAIAAVHLFAGSPRVLPPLMRNEDIPERVRWLLYFNWHVGTVTVLAMAAVFVYLAFEPGHRQLALFATALVAGIGLLGAALTVFGSASLLRTPAPYAFNLIALIAVTGLLNS